MASLTTRLLIPLGLLLLCHACYSAWEHSTFTTLSPQISTLTSSPPQQQTSASLPLDISIETITSVVLICFGLVSGAQELKPISWRAWAGDAEKESGGGGPYQGLEERIGFVDIRAKRKEFADWVRKQDQGGK